VLPFALAFCRRRIEALRVVPSLRLKDGAPYTTDNGNHILDCGVTALKNPEELELALRAIPGVVGTGLFVGMADVVLIQQGDTVEMRSRP
jgi:ribose 5-phosphate isomerase A